MPRTWSPARSTSRKTSIASLEMLTASAVHVSANTSPRPVPLKRNLWGASRPLAKMCTGKTALGSVLEGSKSCPSRALMSMVLPAPVGPMKATLVISSLASWKCEGARCSSPAMDSCLLRMSKTPSSTSSCSCSPTTWMSPRLFSSPRRLQTSFAHCSDERARASMNFNVGSKSMLSCASASTRASLLEPPGSGGHVSLKRRGMIGLWWACAYLSS
mmetsp:Transcript_92877/g.271879  ORF Transcript_92877/g.271879 Transcript_92877/m.271879 type:complete len:216 (-) Transcript_92877:130-777(-)